ncbi:MAG: MaoC family dehydratase N-terminal domain-containing protein [Xanthobacteraceae bacterium]
MAVDRNIIGRSSPEFPCTVEAGKIKEFAASIGETNAAFWTDDENALLAPPTFSHVFRSGKMELLMTDCGLDATKFLHGEHEIEFHRPLKAGDRLKYAIRVADVREASGKRSGPMDIIVLETLVRDQAGTPVQTIRQTFVAKRS